MKNLGIALIIIGAIMMVFTGFNIITKKKVVDLGAVEISRDEKTPIYWSPIAGGIILGVGLLTFFASRKRI
jgi:hypothetical protein